MHRPKKFGGFILLQHFSAVVAAACLSILVVGSSVQVPMMRGSYTYLVTPWNVDTTNYEESYIFQDILESNIADAARMAVLCSQLETDGTYDPEKVIDVTAFVNRAGFLPEEYVTAKYQLEDLLKWHKFGFEKNYMLINANTFFAPAPTYAEPEAVLAEEAAVTADVAQMYADEAGNEYLEVLTCRYQTIDGKNIQDLVSNAEEYAALCNNIEKAASNLYHNYEEYLSYSDFFDASNTNFRYCMEMNVDGKITYLSNLDVHGLKDREIDRLFKGMGRYLYYYPEDMSYESDTGVEEEYLQQIIVSYEYAYPETTKVWMGVDTSYPVSDAYTQTVAIYHNVLPVWWILAGLAMAGFVVFFLLLVFITLWQGHDGSDKEIRLHLMDRMPTEITLLLGLVEILGIVMGVRWLTGLVLDRRIGNTEIIIAVVGMTLIADLILLSIYYSVVRRRKAKTLWTGSLLRRVGGWLWKLLKKLVQLIGNGLFFFADHSSSMMRTLFPCAILFFANFMGMYFFLRAQTQEIRYVSVCGLIVMDILSISYVIKTNMDREKIINGIEQICDGDLQYQIDVDQMHGGNLKLATAVNHIGDGIRGAVETSIKDERMKADLITNVSHDLKTPLTSIINYVNLIKREHIENERIQGYVEVLEQKSQRLKTLTEDLVEASKVSSGNVNLVFEKLNLVELIHQTIGEFTEKFEEKELQVVATFSGNGIYIWADSRRIWRVMENVFGNIYKYALPNTRVYVDMNVTGENETDSEEGEERVEVSIKNISAQPLNIDASQLTERFIRGDVSRTTEGSGLGLSIAKDLTRLQNGEFGIYLDGDLFKVTITFPVYREQKEIVPE